MRGRTSIAFRLLVLAPAMMLWCNSAANAQGTWLSAAGPVNRGMGGASTAAPLDAIGVTYWNPAASSGLATSELSFGMDELYSNHSISSTIGGFSGTTQSENGFFPIPTVGWVQHVEDSPVSLCLFVGGVAGFKTTVNADPTNPVLSAFGRISSEACFMQVAPAISLQVTDQLSLAAGPTITQAELGAEPFIFDAPNLNGSYPSARASRYHFGGGAQFGAYYDLGSVKLGASVKTPTWMERFRFFADDGAGGARIVSADVDLPTIVSVGGAYTGLENWTFALDLRYFDYANTAGFGDPASFESDFSVSGLGWRSVAAASAGAQFQATETLTLRCGYTYNQNPISGSDTMVNLAAPLFYEHMVSAGASFLLVQNVTLNAAYSYYLPETITGPVAFPGVGVIPGASVSQSLDVHVVGVGVSVRY